MKEQAIAFYRKGCNCSQCILKAAETVYNKPVPKQCYAMCQGVNTGFGIGGICSVLVAGVMVFGLFFNEETVKRLRIKLLTEFKRQHGGINCAELVRARGDSARCEAIVGQAADMIKKMIDAEMR